MEVKSYNQFILESYSEENVFYFFVESFYNSSLITQSERNVIQNEMLSPVSFLIKENFFDKLKTRYDRAKLVAKDISQTSKDALQKVVDAAEKASDFIRKIKEYLHKQINIILTQSKDKLKSKLKSNKKLLDEIKNKINADKSAFIGDVKTLKDVVKFYKTNFLDSLLTSISNSLSSFLTKDDKDLSISEKIEYIKEGSNMISKLVHGINNIPPFNWIDDLQKIGTKGSELIIKNLSFITKKLGGPEFILPTIAVILGIAFGYNVEGLIKHGIIDVISFFSIPFITPVIKMVGFIATMIATYELIITITSAIEGENNKEVIVN